MDQSNGSSSRVQVDEERATERTPLLPHARSPTNAPSQDDPPLPPIEPTVLRLLSDSILDVSLSEAWCPRELPSEDIKTAFMLAVLLRLNVLINEAANSGLYRAGDLSQQLSEELNLASKLRNVEHAIDEIWDSYKRRRPSSAELEDVLWTAFPLKEETRLKTLRVIDLLGGMYAPKHILAERFVYVSLLRTWKRGRAKRDRKPGVLAYISYLLDLVCAPRVLHLLDLFLQIAFMLGLVSYVLQPMDEPAESTLTLSPTLREILLTIYSYSQVLQPWRLTTVPFILTALAFTSSFPTIPHPDGIAYGVLLLALIVHLVLLHAPHTPSPVYLFPPPKALPLATLVWHGISKVYLPVLLFFFPAVLFAFYLLSISLLDDLPGYLWTVGTATAVDPAPMETRTAFLILLTVIFVLLIITALLLVLTYPTLSSNPPPATWDRFSLSIGLEARRAFVDVVKTYNPPSDYFPPPFNLASILFYDLPVFLLSRVRWHDRAEQWYRTRTILWKMLVQPVILVFGVFFAWGYFS
ncbi:hypothetical protein K474DRAFT_788914 [Panus rudis PR-1116 ss-1]|nr:hypothetical protein K474DRAFT_788914 [Panus rudis PR-1116 ss-1]